MAKISTQRIGEFMQTILRELQAVGGEARARELFPRVEGKLDLNEYELSRYEKTGYVRWQSFVHFYSINCVKAGFLHKSGGKWYLTDAGAKALRLSPEEFTRTIQEKYRAWKQRQEDTTAIEDQDADDIEEQAVRQTAYAQAVDQARTEIEEYIRSLGPFDFQQLVAELLKALKYHVTFIAPPGPDGGIDIVAYTDPLGATAPRIRVQVKHRAAKAAARDVRELVALLPRDGDIGLFVSSGGFTPDAIREIRSAPKHIEQMDLDRLIRLWERHYSDVQEQGKALLPLTRLYFLAPVIEE